MFHRAPSPRPKLVSPPPLHIQHRFEVDRRASPFVLLPRSDIECYKQRQSIWLCATSWLRRPQPTLGLHPQFAERYTCRDVDTHSIHFRDLISNLAPPPPCAYTAQRSGHAVRTPVAAICVSETRLIGESLSCTCSCTCTWFIKPAHAGLQSWAPIPCFGMHDGFCTTLIGDIATFNYSHASRSSLAAKCLSISVANIQWQRSTRLITAIVGPIFVLAAFSNAPIALVTSSPADIEGVQFASRVFTKHTTLQQISTDYDPIPVTFCTGSHPLQTPLNASSAQLYLPAPYLRATLQTFRTGPRIA